MTIAAPMMRTCASDERGVLRCWGANDTGALGDGTKVDRFEPVEVDVGGPVAALRGEDPLCTLDTRGEVRCWGDPSWGAIGDGTDTRRNVPTPVVGLPRAVAIDGSGTANCAVTEDGSVWCWGKGPKIDDDDGPSVLAPERVDLTNAVEVGVGYSHRCVRDTLGRVFCWGRNNWGQVGDGTTTDREAPVVVAGITAVELAVGSFHSCARLLDGKVSCWGRDMGEGRMMGPEEEHLMGFTPKLVPRITNAVQVTADGNHSCALTATGTVGCWGSNKDGQLGFEPNSEVVRVPKVIPALAGSTLIAAGHLRSCGHIPDRGVVCVGKTFVGRMGRSPRFEIVLDPLGAAPRPTPR